MVNHELEADVEQRVFAIGDCAEVLCKDLSCQVCPGREGVGPSGLVGPGWRQAEWLAARFHAELVAVADGGTAVLAPLTSGPAGAVRLKAHQVELASAGAVGGLPWELRPDGGSVVQWADGGAGTYAKLVLGPDRTLEGYIVLGLPRSAAGIGLLYDRGEAVPEDPSVLLRLDGPDAGSGESPMTPESTVCHCAGVTMGRITDVVEQGAATVEEVGCATRASTGCGGCKAAVARIIEVHRGVAV